MDAERVPAVDLRTPRRIHLVGVGGAAFLCIALSILMDLFPRGVRGRVLAGFFLAMPLGAALGMVALLGKMAQLRAKS